jgi:hypothetical protein
MLQPKPTNLRKRLTRFVGIALLILAWLPGAFLNCPGATGWPRSTTPLKHSPVPAAFAAPGPTAAPQFHQLRLGGSSSWFSKNPGQDYSTPVGATLPAARLPGANEWLSAPPAEPGRPWQFAWRQALHPRAPCAA